MAEILPFKGTSSPQVIASRAEYRRDDFFFRRDQSIATASAEWEGRIKPLKSWGPWLLWGVGAMIIAFGVYAFTIG